MVAGRIRQKLRRPFRRTPGTSDDSEVQFPNFSSQPEPDRVEHLHPSLPPPRQPHERAASFSYGETWPHSHAPAYARQVHPPSFAREKEHQPALSGAGHSVSSPEAFGEHPFLPGSYVPPPSELRRPSAVTVVSPVRLEHYNNIAAYTQGDVTSNLNAHPFSPEPPNRSLPQQPAFRPDAPNGSGQYHPAQYVREVPSFTAQQSQAQRVSNPPREASAEEDHDPGTALSPEERALEERKKSVWEKMLQEDRARDVLAAELSERPGFFHPPSDWNRSAIPSRTQWRRHRALIICVRYAWRTDKKELRGTNGDAREVTRWLVDRMGFELQNVRVLCEGKLGVCGASYDTTVLPPTRKNIVESLSWVVDGMKEGDSGFFFYAGHGEETEDVSGDEVSGFDQVIIPCDSEGPGGHVTDDDIYDLMVKHVPRGARLTALVDACHAGSMLDLPVEFWYRETIEEYKPATVRDPPEFATISSRSRLALRKDPEDPDIGEVILFSATSDMHSAVDAPIDVEGKGQTYMGVFTYCFLREVNRLYPSVKPNSGNSSYGPTGDRSFGEVMDDVKLAVAKRLAEVAGAQEATNFLRRGFRQIPQMSSSHVFDPYATMFGI